MWSHIRDTFHSRICNPHTARLRRLCGVTKRTCLRHFRGIKKDAFERLFLLVYPQSLLDFGGEDVDTLVVIAANGDDDIR